MHFRIAFLLFNDFPSYIVFVLLEQLIIEHTVTLSKTSKKHKQVSIPEKLDVITKADVTPNTP